MAVSYGLIGAIILFGGIGYVFDTLFGTGPWLLVSGLVLGIVLGFVGLGEFMTHR